MNVYLLIIIVTLIGNAPQLSVQKLPQPNMAACHEAAAQAQNELFDRFWPAKSGPGTPPYLVRAGCVTGN